MTGDERSADRPRAVPSYPDRARAVFREDPRLPPEVIEKPVDVYFDDFKVTNREDDAPRIYRPSSADVERYKAIHERGCWNCRFFDQEAGAQEAMRQRFWDRIRREQGWQGGEDWTGPIIDYGLCTDHGGLLAYRWASAERDGENPGCAEWKPSVGRIVRAVFGRS